MNALPLLPRRWLGVAFSLFAAGFLLHGETSRADTIFKAASGTDIGNSANWNGALPGAADVAAWNASSLGAGLTLQAPAYWGGISVASAQSDIDLSGNWGVIVLGAGGIDMSTANVNFALEVPVILNTNQTWNINSNETLNMSGSVIGSWNLDKEGPGTLILSGYSPILGLTTVNAGTVIISGQIHYNENWQHLATLTINSGGTVIVANGNANNFLGQCNYEGTNNYINGGTLEFNTASGTAEAIERAFAFTTNGGTFSVLNTNATLIFDYFTAAMQFSVPAAASITLTGAGYGVMNKSITGYGGIIKDGSGTWTFEQTNTYAGPTVISNGTVVVNGNGALGTGPVTVMPGGTLAGTGLVPGNITLQTGAQAQLTAGTPASWGGSLTLNNNTVHVLINGQLSPGSYALAAYQPGGSTGMFNPTPVIDSGSLAGGCTAFIRSDRGQVILVVVPPPGPHLAILSVNGGSDPQAGIGFNVVVQAQDLSGNPMTMTSDTPILVTLTAGYGILSGNLAGLIPAGSSSTTISNLTYTLNESDVIITATNTSAALLSGDSAPFTVDLGPAVNISLLSDTNCTTCPGMSLANPILVRVTDPGGNLVPGVNVTFSLVTVPGAAIGQSLSVTNVTTAADGTASAILTLGDNLGTYVVNASVANTGLPGPFTNTAVVTATAANAKWTQVWSDEFNYSGLPDSNRWNYEIGFVRNGESEYYTSNRLQNTYITNGLLSITARKEEYVPPGQFFPVANYTSASLITLAKESWTYGRFEVRAKEPLPMGGVWTAFWTQGTNFPTAGWPVCGEIDISEYVNWAPYPHGNAFWGYNGGMVSDGTIYRTPNVYDDFHIYAVEWTTERMDFYYDNVKFYTIYVDEAGTGPDNAFRNPQYIILNFALGGQWAGTIYDPGLPQQFLIDYVRVYQQLPTWTGSGGDGLWSSATNWTNAVAPAPGSRVVFAGPPPVTSSVDNACCVDGISFYETAGSNVINATAGGLLTLTTNGISNYSTNVQVINAPIVLAANQTIHTDPGGIVISGPISGTGFGLNKNGSGTLTLCGTNTYTGGTTISAGTLALGAGCSLQTSSLNLAAGVTLDLSACTNYMVPSGLTVRACGCGTMAGVSAASLNSGCNNTVCLTGNPINLMYDGVNPSLYVSQGTLMLAGNAFTINTTNGAALAPGTYPIIVQASGNLASTGAFPAVSGTAIGAGQTGYIAVSNNTVNLVIATSSTVSLNVPVVQGDRTVQLTFTGVNSNLLYRVQANNDLTTTNWVTLYTNLTGTNGAAAIIDMDASNSPQRFYRVVTP